MKSEIRVRRTACFSLALLIGVVGGTVTAGAAGARRTDTAYRRFLAAHLAADLVVYSNPEFGEIDLAAVARLPGVAATSRASFLGVTEPDINLVVPSGPGPDLKVDRPRLLHGRMPSPSRPDEAAVPFTLARSRRIEVGDTLIVHRILPGTAGGGRDSQTVPVSFRVVGIEASPGEFPPLPRQQDVHLSQALDPGRGSPARLAVRLTAGQGGVDAFAAAVQKLAGEQPVLMTPRAPQTASVQRSMHLEALAIWLVAGALALVACLVLAQLLARQSFLGGLENPTLSALGMTRPQLWAVGMARAGAIALPGVSIAATTAWLLSALFPLGNAIFAETDPGPRFDGLAVGLGSIAVETLVVGMAAVPAWRSARTPSRSDEMGGRPSAVARVVEVTGVPVPLSVGLRMATHPGQGASAIPVRSTVVGVAVAIAALAASLTFGASLTHLLTTPRLYGWTWDAYLDRNEPAPTDLIPSMIDDPAVEAVAKSDSGVPLALDGHETRGFALASPLKGSVGPVVVNGRAPGGNDEVAVGARTLRQLGKRVGEQVEVRVTAFDGSPPVSKQIVGVVVLPSMDESIRFGIGAFLTYQALQSLLPDGVVLPDADLVVRFAPDANEAASVASLQSRVGPAYAVQSARRPPDVENFAQVERLPLLLAGLLGLLAAATLMHTLLSVVRRRRHDLAILKSLGFTAGQVRAAVICQASTLVAAALVLSIPLGVAAGRSTWRLLAHELGAAAEPTTPSLALVLLVILAALLTLLAAAGPAWAAGRTRPVHALRTE